MSVKTCKKPPISYPVASGNICTFNSQYDGLPLKSHIVDIEYTGSEIGSITITANNESTEITFDSPIYGGYYNAVTGILTSNKASDGSDITPVKTQEATCLVNVILGRNEISADCGETSVDYMRIGR